MENYESAHHRASWLLNVHDTKNQDQLGLVVVVNTQKPTNTKQTQKLTAPYKNELDYKFFQKKVSQINWHPVFS